ncbi:hypothetical protein AAAT94_16665 [Intestinimonas aquisgranensis]
MKEKDQKNFGTALEQVRNGRFHPVTEAKIKQRRKRALPVAAPALFIEK